LNRIGVDVGGTFTDVFLVSDRGVIVHKIPSTPKDPSVATLDAMASACAKAGFGLAELDLIFHGTTVATNTLLERTGAKVGLITTEGFRDVLHIARHKRPLNFSLYQELPWQTRPLIPRRLRLTVPERVEPPDGVVTKSLDEAAVRLVARKLADDGIDAVAVCFLHSYLNPTHERMVAEILMEELPQAFVSLRHVVCPEYREYEAFNTVAINAYLGPVTGKYLARLADELSDQGVRAQPLFMTSSGGVEPAGAVSRKPVSMLMSGPVAGVMGGLAAGRSAGFSNLITLDVGGTSADIGVVDDGRLRYKHWLDNEIGGLGLRLPMVDVSTIGAGGGSIAYVDQGGMLQVGPRSAGADPGPACYGRGGREPTVTDAQLVLGRLSENALLGGRLTISARLAGEAIIERIARPFGLGLLEAAAGIVRVATSHMVGAIELNSVRRGYDPRDFTLVAFGGAGPLFAGDISRELSIPGIVVPRFPGILAAMGLLSSNVLHAYSTSIVRTVVDIPHDLLEERFRALEARALIQLSEEGFSQPSVVLKRYAECRYTGQGYEVRVEAQPGPVDVPWIETLVEAFHSAHEREYAHKFQEGKVELVTVGLEAIGLLQPLRLPEMADDGRRSIPVGKRPVWFEEASDMVSTTIHARHSLGRGAILEGPALVEQEDSTVLIPPGTTALTDSAGNITVSGLQA